MSIPVQSQTREIINQFLDATKDKWIQVSHAIHDRPEIGNQEFFACETHTKTLREYGFEVEVGIAGHETGFIARKKSTKTGPIIGFLAEYDALPGLGHACGHNIIGTASVAAGIALGELIENIGGEVVVFGTPAEEGGPNGSAKGSFVKAGYLQGVDACAMIHPSADSSTTTPSLAVDPLIFSFYGKPAHAAAAPEEGINALDGVIQLYNGINALRQHLTDDVRIHGIISNGGEAPNIVPAYAEARFFLRAAKRSTLNKVTRKVKAIAEGAALATGARVEIKPLQNEVDELLPIASFDEVVAQELELLGETVARNSTKGIGSTDAGNVSQVVPTVHAYIKIGPSDLVGHTDEFREAAKSPLGDAALLKSAKALALSGYRLLTEPELLSTIQKDFRKEKAKNVR
ncbi:M20 family metallopeptidase [Risungbinella massiliensis]|uniref:M20 family metallopeptidase n=1 Tax=Risungbinella massiliensis TaxID=1329796 RepID=UPI0005CC25D9|nr:M20 family metallopeptidase [Risungbinella massiliensis]